MQDVSMHDDTAEAEEVHGGQAGNQDVYDSAFEKPWEEKEHFPAAFWQLTPQQRRTYNAIMDNREVVAARIEGKAPMLALRAVDEGYNSGLVAKQELQSRYLRILIDVVSRSGG
ncbi:hypothetical protein MY11210_001927 [Beauveria gryllotalpidicola]